MADNALKAKIYGLLKRGYFNGPDDSVYVSDGSEDLVHLVVVSEKFDGRRSRDKRELLWEELAKGLSEEELGHISLSIARSPEEIKAG